MFDNNLKFRFLAFDDKAAEDGNYDLGQKLGDTGRVKLYLSSLDQKCATKVKNLGALRQALEWVFDRTPTTLESELHFLVTQRAYDRLLKTLNNQVDHSIEEVLI